ncbi:MAG: helix-turn-helix transcriptional regulator, partial [Mycobacteriaceae bacterium]|nr:helix-turn-helix transcriptional regulator [Mycobacteriaceae bacterium]
MQAEVLQQVFSDAPATADANILDAALSAFLDFGVKRTSMGEIARRAKVSPATLYRKFPSKYAVVESVGLREARRLVATVDGAVDTSASGADQVADCFAAFGRELTRNRLLRRLLDTEPEAVLPHLTTKGATILALGRAHMAQFIRRLHADGELPAFDAARAEQVAEICARLSLSFALTPDGIVDITDDAAARAFAKVTI